jgi:hypothetical protein
MSTTGFSRTCRGRIGGTVRRFPRPPTCHPIDYSTLLDQGGAGWTERVCGRKKGIFAPAQPSGPRQIRLKDPRAVRPGCLPLSVAVSTANTNDSFALKPLVMAIPAIRTRRGLVGVNPTSYTPTKPTTRQNSDAGSAIRASPSALPAEASTPARNSAKTSLGRRTHHCLANRTLGAAVTCLK